LRQVFLWRATSLNVADLAEVTDPAIEPQRDETRVHARFVAAQKRIRVPGGKRFVLRA
jgi:hypothetical protein